MQLKRPEKALAYIMEYARQVELLGSVYQLRFPKLVLCLLHWVIEAEREGIKVTIDCSTDLSKLMVEEDQLISLVAKVCRVIVSELSRTAAGQKKVSVNLGAGESMYRLAWEIAVDDCPHSVDWRGALLEPCGRARDMGGKLEYVCSKEMETVELLLPF